MTLYFWLFVAISLALVVAACIRPVKFFEYPYFMGATFAVFIGPQAYALLEQADYWPAEALTDTFLMCLLCVGACWVGYQARPNLRFLEKVSVSLNSGRLLRGGILFVFAGFIFDHLIAQLPEEAKGISWTGIVTIYGFFAMLIYPGFAICLYCAMRWGGWLSWVFTILASIIPLQAALFFGRREPTVLFVLSFALVFYFVNGKKPPRLGIIAGVLGATLFIPTTTQYRQIARDDPLEAIKQLRPLESLTTLSQPDAILELKNAMFVIAATQYTREYQHGMSYWNQMVFRFVPAQIVGAEVKNSLMTDGGPSPAASLVTLTLSGAAYLPPIGSTVTGVADTYWQFGFLGCLFFAVVGVLFKNLWCAANDYDSFPAQVLYIPILISAMRAVTHGSIDFLPSAIYSSFFVGLVILYARERLSERCEMLALAEGASESQRAAFVYPQR